MDNLLINSKATFSSTQREKCIFLSFTLNHSGIADHYIALTNELISRGFKVVIITTNQKKALLSKDSNPAIYTWPSKRATRFTDVFFLARLIRKHKPKMIITNFSATNICLLTSYLFRVPLRYATHLTAADLTKKISLRNRLVEEIQILLKTILYHSASKILAVSQHTASEVKTIHHVNDEKIFIFHITANAIPKKSLAEPQNFSILFVGGITYGKGVDVLIKAFYEVSIAMPEAHLEIVGEGDYKQTIESLVNRLKLHDKITLIGPLSHIEALQRIGNAYIVVVPSRFDAFPKVVLESMSFGVPVIATNTGGIPEMLRDQVDGFLVPVDNSVLISDKIILLLKNKNLRDIMGKNAYEYFLENFEMNSVVEKQVDWLEEQINQI